MGVAKLEFFPFLTGIFGSKDEKSLDLAKKIQKKFRNHVLNSLLVGRLAVGELLEYRKLRLRDTHPGTPLVLVSAHTCDVRFTPKSGHSSAPSRCPLCANSGHLNSSDRFDCYGLINRQQYAATYGRAAR